MTLPIDAYSLRARLAPALLAILPALALLFSIVSWREIELTHLIVSLAAMALIYAFTDLARRLGKRLDHRIFSATGGMPSVRMLRHRDPEIGSQEKARLHGFLSSETKLTAPTVRTEVDDPIAADKFYEASCAWLREHTRDTSKFHILFEENISYGFRRNLLGLKPIGLALNMLVVAICTSVILFGDRIGLNYDLKTFSIVFVVAAIHAIYFIFGVTQRPAEEAANSYGRQLLASVHVLSADQP